MSAGVMVKKTFIAWLFLMAVGLTLHFTGYNLGQKIKETAKSYWPSKVESFRNIRSISPRS